MPAETGTIRNLGEHRVGVLILLHDPDASSASPAQALAEAFELTPRAAELTAALAAGEGLKNYAKHAGLTLNTARFHLKVAFSRTGARSQAQLVGFAVRALADLPL
ncbi:MAG: hypothetical protein P4L33_22340 [Capsulimonadaceae bacterium]|nr:hypothetical protein [Capsulimonadaceae bacterium]